jgi:hypothetical protein
MKQIDKVVGIRTLSELSKLITQKVEFTNQEQNEDVSLGIVIETILFGRDSNRKKRFINQFELTDDEIVLLEANTNYFHE